jgi:hypothetical protein
MSHWPCTLFPRLNEKGLLSLRDVILVLALGFVGSFPEQHSTNNGTMKGSRLVVQTKKKPLTRRSNKSTAFIKQAIKSISQ